MKILITGGLGQIGSFTAEALLARGNEVIVIDNLSSGRKAHLDPHKNLKVIIGSIADKKLIEQVFAENLPNIVIHSAASFKDPHDWYNDTMTNCLGSANIILACKTNKVNRLIYFQTSLCYGRRTNSSFINLDNEIDPGQSSYSISKTVGEQYLQLSGLDFVSFRLANVIGPRNLAGPLPIFYNRLKENQQCYIANTKRDFIAAKDLVKLVLKACDGVGHGVYHFGSGKEITIKKLFTTIAHQMDISEYLEPIEQNMAEDDVSSILLNTSRTIADYGVIDFMGIEQIVHEALNYFNEYGTMGEFTHLKMFVKN